MRFPYFLNTIVFLLLSPPIGQYFCRFISGLILTLFHEHYFFLNLLQIDIISTFFFLISCFIFPSSLSSCSHSKLFKSDFRVLSFFCFIFFKNADFAIIFPLKTALHASHNTGEDTSSLLFSSIYVWISFIISSFICPFSTIEFSRQGLIDLLLRYHISQVPPYINNTQV